jgi:hypothetical protein
MTMSSATSRGSAGSEYIVNNPLKWHLDRENPANIGHVARRAGREAGPYK